jgi:hypothetical protein
MNIKIFGRKQSWSNFKVLSPTFLEGLRKKNTKIRITGSGARLNPEPYKESRSIILDHVVRCIVIPHT